MPLSAIPSSSVKKKLKSKLNYLTTTHFYTNIQTFIKIIRIKKNNAIKVKFYFSVPDCFQRQKSYFDVKSENINSNNLVP